MNFQRCCYFVGIIFLSVAHFQLFAAEGDSVAPLVSSTDKPEHSSNLPALSNHPYQEVQDLPELPDYPYTIYRPHTHEAPSAPVKTPAIIALAAEQTPITSYSDKSEGKDNGLRSSNSHQCKKCGKRFIRLQYLQLHMDRIHENSGCYPCRYKNCTKKCNTENQRDRHERSHECKPFQCSECLWEGTKPQSFLDHSRKTHRVTNPFICADPACTKRFNTMQDRRKHIKKEHPALPPHTLREVLRCQEMTTKTPEQ